MLFMDTPEELRRDLIGIDTVVPLLRGGERPYINLDNAASTPALQPVMDELAKFIPWYSSVHRGTGFKSRMATEAYEQARETVGRFVGADPNEHVVIFGKNATEAINKLSYRLDLNKRDIVITSSMEHHSNDLPWRARATVRYIRLTPVGGLDMGHYRRLLEESAGRLKLVTVTGASNVTGYMPDIKMMARLAHAAGAQFAVDAAQLAPHRRISMGRLDDPAHIDYLAMSAHKMYAPFGTGALVGRRDTFERGAPEYRGGGTVAFVSLSGVAWAPPPDRDEAGSPNVVGAVAFAAALKTLEHIGMGRIAAHESVLTAYALRQLRTVRGLMIYGDSDPANAGHRAGVVPFMLDNTSHFLTAAVLGYEHGIGVRNGCFCAHPYVVRLLGVSNQKIREVQRRLAAGQKPGMPGLVRASFGMYNTAKDIDTLVQGLRDIQAGKMAVYRQNEMSGDFTPLEVQPSWMSFLS
jgi:selenocysteine lyase/cysteine desulfurase